MWSLTSLLFIYRWIINLASINSRTNFIAFKWTLVVGSLAFIIHSPFPCLTERCSVCLRVKCILIEINPVWLHYKSGHWIAADMKSTEYFIRVVPLVAWQMIPPGDCLCLGGVCGTHWGTWVGACVSHWGVQIWGHICFNAHTCNLVHGPPSISIPLGNGVQIQASTCW